MVTNDDTQDIMDDYMNNLEEHMEWDEWKEHYDPVMVEQCHDDGILLELDVHQDVIAYIKENLPHIAEDDIAKHVWTITAGDGWQYTSTGFHFVDRESYLICLNPWKRENEACMYDDWGTWCDHCDEYVKECEHED
jgi:hypothetical protein